MLKRITILAFSTSLIILATLPMQAAPNEQYVVGIGDILEINIIQPEQLLTRTTVSPGGDISVPYLGSVMAKGLTVTQLQQNIQWRLANGFFKYPVVTVSLIESRSKNYTISGEVVTPGNYPLGENTTVLKAISIAGGFTRFGSSSRVKILRPRKDRPGYRQIKVDIKAVMDGDARADIVIEAGDIIVVSEGIF